MTTKYVSLHQEPLEIVLTGDDGKEVATLVFDGDLPSPGHTRQPLPGQVDEYLSTAAADDKTRKLLKKHGNGTIAFVVSSHYLQLATKVLAQASPDPKG